MERAEKVMKKASELVEKSEKPTAVKLAQELDMPEQDVHRCLNHLERQSELETYTKKVLGQKHRMVGVKR